MPSFVLLKQIQFIVVKLSLIKVYVTQKIEINLTIQT